MVRPSLAGTKTQTRRVVKRLPCQCDDFEPEEVSKMSPEGWQLAGHSGRWWCKCCTSNDDIVACPYGQPGDRLWVRECFGYCNDEPMFGAFYRAEELVQKDYAEENGITRWRRSIHMPRWASRLTLEIAAVRVERLQDISEADAIAEGIEPYTDNGVTTYKNYLTDEMGGLSAVESYKTLWESINGPGSWALNPWVWVVEFWRVVSA